MLLLIKECHIGRNFDTGSANRVFVDMPCRPLPSYTLDSFQSLKSSLIPKVHGDSLQTNAVLFWIFPSDLLFPQSHVPRSACFLNVVPATFAGKTRDTIRSLLWRTFWPSSHKWVCVPQFGKSFNIVSVRYTFELLRDTPLCKVKVKV